jgi:hypothetical protein
MQLQCYLIDGQYDQVGTSGLFQLEDGRLRFTLDKDAGTRGKLKWLEKALATENLQDRIQAGEKVVVFETPVSGQEADSGTGAPKEWKTARAEAGAQ